MRVTAFLDRPGTGVKCIYHYQGTRTHYLITGSTPLNCPDNTSYEELSEWQRSELLSALIFWSGEDSARSMFEFMLRKVSVDWSRYEMARRRNANAYPSALPIRHDNFFREWVENDYFSCPLRFFRIISKKPGSDHHGPAIALTPLAFAETPLPPHLSDQIPPTPRRPVAQSWIEAQVLDADGNPVIKLPYAMELPNQQIVKGQTDQDGRIHHKPIPEGVCNLKLGPHRAACMHTVQDGEGLQSLAHLQRINPLRIWDHPKNQALFQLRKNPHILHPGDELYLPEGIRECPGLETGQCHKLQFGRYPCEIRMVVDVASIYAEKSVHYQLELEDGTMLRGCTTLRADSPSKLAMRIPATVDSGVLTVFLDPEDPEQNLRVNVGLGHLCPVDETRGLQARLRNLGYDVGELDGSRGPRTEQGLEAFRQDLRVASRDKRPGVDEQELARRYGA